MMKVGMMKRKKKLEPKMRENTFLVAMVNSVTKMLSKQRVVRRRRKYSI